jgi:hypothetical protein
MYYRAKKGEKKEVNAYHTQTHFQLLVQWISPRNFLARAGLRVDVAVITAVAPAAILRTSDGTSEASLFFGGF